MSKAAKVLQNAIEVECHDILRGVDGKTSGCLFHGDEAERLIDAAVAPLVTLLERIADSLAYEEGSKFVNCDIDHCPHTECASGLIEKALEQWRTGR